MEHNLDIKKTSKSLFKNTGILTVGQISTKIISFFLLPLYTGYLSTEEYGSVDLFMSLGSLMIVVFGLQISQSIFKFLTTLRNNKEQTKKVTSTSFFSTLIMIVIFFVAFFISQFFYHFPFAWWLFLYVSICLLFQILTSFSRGVGDNVGYSIGNFLSATVSIAINVVLIVVFGMKSIAIIYGLLAGPIVGSIFIFIRSKAWQLIDFKAFDKTQLKRILAFCLPLIPNELSWAVIHTSDRLVVSHFISLSAEGILAAASKFGSIFLTLFNVFGLAWTEQIILIFNKKGWKDFFNNMFDKLIFIFGSLAILIVSSLRIIFPLLVGPAFSDALTLIPLYMIAVFFNAIIGLTSSIMVADNKTWEIAISTTIAAIVNLGIDLLLIRFVGIYAAPISSIAGYLVVTIWRVFFINKKYCKIHFRIKFVIGLAIMLLISLFSCFAKISLKACLSCCFINLGIFVFLTKGDIIDLFRWIKDTIDKRRTTKNEH